MSSHWIQNDLSVEGACIHYARTGAGSDKPAMVLVHGFSDNGLCWTETAMELEADYDIVMPDMRGHGLSERVRPGSKTDMTADIAAIIRAMGLNHPIVGGHSMGAMVTAQLGARYPEIARALILEDPAWFGLNPGESRPSIISAGSPVEKWIKGMDGQSLEEVMVQTRAEHPGWADRVVHHWTEGKKQLDWNFFTTQDTSWGNWQEVARAITVPTLLITADVDLGGIITPEIAMKAVELNPKIHVAHIPGAGHHVRFGKYDEYMAAVKAFLKELA